MTVCLCWQHKSFGSCLLHKAFLPIPTNQSIHQPTNVMMTHTYPLPTSFTWQKWVLNVSGVPISQYWVIPCTGYITYLWSCWGPVDHHCLSPHVCTLRSNRVRLEREPPTIWNIQMRTCNILSTAMAVDWIKVRQPSRRSVAPVRVTQVPLVVRHCLYAHPPQVCLWW